MKKKKFIWILKLSVGVVLVYFLFREVNRGHAILYAFRRANWVNVSLGFILLIPNFFIQFYKWRYLLKNRFPEVESRTAFQSLLFGATLGFVTPGNLGELARALFFKKYDRLVIIGLNIMDKLFGMIIFISVGFVSLTVIVLTKFSFPAYLVFPLLVLGVIFLLIVWTITLNPQWLRSFLYGVNTMLPVREKIKSIISCLDNFHRRHSLWLLLVNFAWFIIIFLQYHVLILAFTTAPEWVSFVSVSAILFTKVVLPVSIADLGIREGAAVFYYSLYRVPQVASFNAALLIFVINFLLPALAGSYFVFKLKWDANGNRPVPDESH